jgi:hypothetical protein
MLEDAVIPFLPNIPHDVNCDAAKGLLLLFQQTVHCHLPPIRNQFRITFGAK